MVCSILGIGIGLKAGRWEIALVGGVGEQRAIAVEGSERTLPSLCLYSSYHAY